MRDSKFDPRVSPHCSTRSLNDDLATLPRSCLRLDLPVEIAPSLTDPFRNARDA